MNITHAVEEKIEGDKLEAIFERQKSLMFKYHDIEKKSGLLQTEDCPVNLDDKRGQARIKDFSWRVMEEVGEALDAKENGDKEHFCEELIDGLHFLTELTILAGYEPKDICWEEPKQMDMLDYMVMNVEDVMDNDGINKYVANLVMDLGMMCNCLKNKPWKQTNMITDKEHFHNKLCYVWNDYIQLLSIQMNAIEIAMVYLKKSQVNKFRQRSGY